MAQKSNGHISKLDAAITALMQAQATLVQNQATLTQTQGAFIQSQAALQAEMAALRRETAERFERIEDLLMEHTRILAALPDAVRQKFGFRPPEPA